MKFGYDYHIVLMFLYTFKFTSDVDIADVYITIYKYYVT